MVLLDPEMVSWPEHTTWHPWLLSFDDSASSRCRLLSRHNCTHTYVQIDHACSLGHTALMMDGHRRDRI